MSDTHTSETSDRSPEGITIRRLDDRDAEALMHLAALDSAAPADSRRGDWIGVEVEGRLLAAASLNGGRTVADPFTRTDELRALLELRVSQLGERTSHRNVHRVRQRGRAAGRPTLAGSRPGAGGRLVTLRPY